LRVIDLEALSIQADVVRFLGQFAGVLIMISLLSFGWRVHFHIGYLPSTPERWLSLEWSTSNSPSQP
jgi:hypothetical protein